MKCVLLSPYENENYEQCGAVYWGLIWATTYIRITLERAPQGCGIKTGMGNEMA